MATDPDDHGAFALTTTGATAERHQLPVRARSGAGERRGSKVLVGPIRLHPPQGHLAMEAMDAMDAMEDEHHHPG